MKAQEGSKEPCQDADATIKEKLVFGTILGEEWDLSQEHRKSPGLGLTPGRAHLLQKTERTKKERRDMGSAGNGGHSKVR